MIDRMTELEELIMAGWGDMRGDQIPADWRNRQPNEGISYKTSRSLREEVFSLGEVVMMNEAIRRKSGRPKGTGTPHQSWDERIARRQAAMRKRMRKTK